LCGEVFTAEAPEGVGQEKYDETATSMVGLLKYGCGLPFYRIEKLQQNMGIPLPATTQWELVREGSKLLAPVHEELVHQAAQGEVLHNDDTVARVLELTCCRAGLLMEIWTGWLMGASARTRGRASRSLMGPSPDVSNGRARPARAGQGEVQLEECSEAGAARAHSSCMTTRVR